MSASAGKSTAIGVQPVSTAKGLGALSALLGGEQLFIGQGGCAMYTLPWLYVYCLRVCHAFVGT